MSNDFEAAFIRIFQTKFAEPAGAGFLLDEKHIFTCAHVIADALGLERTTPILPESEVRLDFPLVAPGQIVVAKVVAWQPMLAEILLVPPLREDIAVLELISALPETAKPCLPHLTPDYWQHSFRAYGFPEGDNNGVHVSGTLMDKLANGWVQIDDNKGQGYFVKPGFSGGPVWDEKVGGIVGIVVAADRRVENRSARMIPTLILANAWPPLLKQLNREKLTEVAPPSPNVSLPPSKLTIPNNLGSAEEPILGRENEISEIGARLRKPGTRLVTLTGVAGAGKTRLSLAVAEELLKEFKDGVFIVYLENIKDQNNLIGKIADTLNIKDVKGKTQLETLKEHLNDKQMLLVLDNFEQLVNSASSFLGEFLKTIPTLKLLISSRIVINISLEWEFEVDLLKIPEKKLPIQELKNYASIALFIARAHSNFTLSEENAGAVVQICRKLDGLPLAIELVAAQTRFFAPQMLLERLSLKLLTGGSQDLPARQQTIRGAIDCSYELLEEDEKQHFARLAIFSGGCTIVSAEVVCPVEDDMALEVFDAIESLMRNNLLRRWEGKDNETRYGMLQTIREYALEKLKANGELDSLSQRHASYFLSVVKQAEPHLRGGPEQTRWFKRLEQEKDNFQTALTWYLQLERQSNSSEAGEKGLELSSKMFGFWFMQGYYTEGRHWLEAALNATDSQATPTSKPLRAIVLRGAGILAYSQGDYTPAVTFYEAALDLFRQLEDRGGIATCLNNLAVIAMFRADYEKSKQLYLEGLTLYREVGNKLGEAKTNNNLALIALNQSRFDDADSLTAQAIKLFRELKNQQGEAEAMGNQGLVAFAKGQYPAALYLHQESLKLFKVLGYKAGIANALDYLGIIWCIQGDYIQAETHYRESLELRIELNDQAGMTRSLDSFALLASAQTQSTRAAKLWGAAQTLHTQLTEPIEPIFQPIYNTYQNEIKSNLGAEYQIAVDFGSSLSSKKAVAYALDLSAP